MKCCLSSYPSRRYHNWFCMYMLQLCLHPLHSIYIASHVGPSKGSRLWIPCRRAHVARVCQQKLAARERQLACLCPAVVLGHAEADARVANLVAVDAVGQAERAAGGLGLAVDVVAELADELEEGDHGVVEAAVEEAQAEGQVAAGAVELEDVLLGRGGRARGAGIVAHAAGSRAGGVEAHNLGRAAHGLRLVALEAELELIGNGDEEEQRVAPGGVDLGPVDGLAREAAQAEAVDCREAAVVADAESVVVDVGALEFLQQLRVVAVLCIDAVPLRLEIGHLGGESIALAPKGRLFLVELPRLVLQRENLLVEGVLFSLETLQLFHCCSLFDLSLALPLLGRLLVGVARLRGADVLEVGYVGVARASGRVQLTLQAVDQHVGALDADRVVNIGAGGEDLEEAVYAAYLVVARGVGGVGLVGG